MAGPEESVVSSVSSGRFQTNQNVSLSSSSLSPHAAVPIPFSLSSSVPVSLPFPTPRHAASPAVAPSPRNASVDPWKRLNVSTLFTRSGGGWTRNPSGGMRSGTLAAGCSAGCGWMRPAAAVRAPSEVGGHRNQNVARLRNSSLASARTAPASPPIPAFAIMSAGAA